MVTGTERWDPLDSRLHWFFWSADLDDVDISIFIQGGELRFAFKK